MARTRRATGPADRVRRAQPFAELGGTGLRRQSGLIDEEFLRSLRGGKAIQAFREMRDNDPVIGAMLFAIEQLARQVEWRVEPGDESADATATADFVSGALLNDMSVTWPDTLSEILSMLAFGWSFLEIVYKRRLSDRGSTRSAFDDGRIGWRKWAIRAQESLERWEFDDEGGAQAMVQRLDVEPHVATIPIEKALLFRTTVHKGNPEGRSILRNAYRCFTPDHDVLTRRGWVPIAAVRPDDLVATLNPATDTVEWQPSTDQQMYQHRGPLVHVTAKHLDLLVTGNHDLWARPGRSAVWGFARADRVTPSMRMRRDFGRYDGVDPGAFPLPEIRWVDRNRVSHPARMVPSSAWAEFLGFWLADGTAGTFGTDRRFRVALYQREGRGADWVRRLLKRCGFAWDESDGHGVVTFNVHAASQLRTALELYAAPKRVPPYVRAWTPGLIRRFLDAHLRGDGHVVQQTLLHFTSVEALADDLHELAVLSGAAASKSRRTHAGMWWVTRGRVPTTGSRCRRVETEWYEGPVHCITVPPYHLIYVRRSGKGCWVGQSWFFKKRIEEIEAIGIERDLAGYPMLKLLEGAPDIWNDKDPVAVSLRAHLEKVVRSVRRDEQEGLLLPVWAEFKLLSTESRRQFDTTAIISRYDQRIAMTVLADFILIGHERVGSFALSSNKTRIFSVALGAFLDAVAEVVNRHAIPRLLGLNGIRPEKPPRLVHGDVEEPDLGQLGEYIERLSRAGFPLFPDPELQRRLKEAGKLPLGKDAPESTEDDDRIPVTTQPAPGGDDGDDDAGGEE